MKGNEKFGLSKEAEDLRKCLKDIHKKIPPIYVLCFHIQELFRKNPNIDILENMPEEIQKTLILMSEIENELEEYREGDICNLFPNINDLSMGQEI